MVRSGIEAEVFDRRVLHPEVSVRLILTGVLACTRWLPPLGKDEPDAVGRQLASFYVSGLVGSGTE